MLGTAARRLVLVSTLGALLSLLVACPSGTVQPPTGGSSVFLSISSPPEGQSLSGTVAVAAAGVGGTAEDLTFHLGTLQAAAADDGTAVINTRPLTDGAYTLEARAVVAGREVSDRVDVVVRNDLPDSGVVGPEGGALRSSAGSLAIIPPGALASGATVSVADTTQEEILAQFGVDYNALGVTFLGALTVDTGGVSVELPMSVDLSGWAEAVQPGQQVVMFALAPDADGDGVGELTFAANAQATPDGSVVTRPIPRSEVYGFTEPGGSALRRAATAKPGEIVSVSGRGFNPVAAVSNVARYGPLGAPVAETLVHASIAEPAAFNPLMQVQFAVPAPPAGNEPLRLHNLTTGYRTDPIDLTVGATGTAPAGTWPAFAAQVRTAVTILTAGRSDLATFADAALDLLDAQGPSLAAAMAHNAGVVSSGNHDLLAAMSPGALTALERDLVIRHALLLDAIAVSVPSLAAAAADLATLLVTTAQSSDGTGATASTAVRLQSGDVPCDGTATTPTSADISIGSPVTTGMGSGPPGSCINGDVVGGGGASGSSIDPHRPQASALATTSVRSGSFRPLHGAYIFVNRAGTSERLAPFTAISNAAGFFTVPFVAPGEPFSVHAIDPLTGATASYEGVSAGSNVTTQVQLLLTPGTGPSDAVKADFSITPVADPRFEGTVYFTFDASASTADGAEILEYVWDFGGHVAGGSWMSIVTRGYGRNGTYPVTLTVIDELFRWSTTSQELVIDDLPHDYWGLPPERVDVGPDGTLPDQEAWYGFDISADGRYVTFTTDATNLDSNDVNGSTDVYRKDMATGAVELVSSGASGNSADSDVKMSGDGRFVAFMEHRPGARPAVIRDMVEGTSLEFVNPDGYSSNSVRGLSADGGTLAFVSRTLNVAHSGAYVVDVATEEIVRIGLRLDGETYAIISISGMSADGRYVVFESSDDQLVEDDTNQRSDVFVLDMETGETVRASEASDGTEGDQWSRTWGNRVISDDGRFVTFWSNSSTFLPGGNPGNHAQVFVKDLETGALELVSTSDAGVRGDSASVLGSISGDGRYVAFGSYASNFAPEMDRSDGNCDLSMCMQGFSFVKDRQTGRVMLVTVGLNDALPDDWDQIEPIISADGRYVGFYSWATNLDPNDASDAIKYFRAENPLWAE